MYTTAMICDCSTCWYCMSMWDSHWCVVREYDLLVCLSLLYLFWDKLSHCITQLAWKSLVDQAGLEFIETHVCFQVLGLKAYSMTFSNGVVSDIISCHTSFIYINTVTLACSHGYLSPPLSWLLLITSWGDFHDWFLWCSFVPITQVRKKKEIT